MKKLLDKEEVIYLKDLIIVGAGGFGRELLQWVKDINKIENRWNILGFIDDTEDPLKDKACDYKVIGTIVDWEPKENQEFALAIADPNGKVIVANQLKEKGAKFATVIHPTASINEFAEMGEGLVVYPRATIGPNTQIGDFVTILSCGVGHDASIGSYSTICAFCDITGYVQIGEKVFVASSVSIIPKRKIGDGAYIGAGSVVIGNVRAGVHVFGNPAKKMDIY